MKFLQCVFVLAFSLLLCHVCCEDSSTNPSPPALANSPPTYFNFLPIPKFETPTTTITGTKLDEVNPFAHTQTKVKSFLLVLQWPAGVCFGQSGLNCKKPMPATDFVMHGLWPQFSKTDPPTKSPDRLGNQITVLLTRLRASWPTLKDKDQDALFWSHQWNDHGVYSEMKVLPYFTKALDLFEPIGPGLENRLKFEDIKANGSIYNRQVIETALSKIIGKKCQLICVPSKTAANVELLQEIRISYSTSFNMQDNGASSRCNAVVRFPSLTGSI